MRYFIENLGLIILEFTVIFGAAILFSRLLGG